MLAAFNNETGQATRRICTRVDVDTVRQNFWLLGWSVAVNDPLAKVHFAIEKLLTNP